MKAADTAKGWTRGEAPRDGNLYVAMGRIVATDEEGGYSIPFLSRVRWGGSCGWSGWVDEDGLAICSYLDAQVHVDHWIGLPSEILVKIGEEVAA